MNGGLREAPASDEARAAAPSDGAPAAAVRGPGPLASRRRAEPRVHGIIPLAKPSGMTSFDAVRQVRRIIQERRVGHAGTLDPTATGLLPICVGQATRLVDLFHLQPKRYHCVVRLGERSATMDTEGPVLSTADASQVTAADVSTALEGLVGEIEQIPPMHSAVRHEGRHLYDLAREGTEVERRPRSVVIHSVDVVDVRPGPVTEVELDVSCGKGAYMRVLASDLGDALGVGGLLGWLERTEYGSLSLRDAVTLESLSAMEDPAAALLPPETAASHLPRVDLAPPLDLQVRRGQRVWVARLPQPRPVGPCRVHGPDGTMIALGDLRGSLLRPVKVLAVAPAG